MLVHVAVVAMGLNGPRAGVNSNSNAVRPNGSPSLVDSSATTLRHQS